MDHSAMNQSHARMVSCRMVCHCHCPMSFIKLKKASRQTGRKTLKRLKIFIGPPGTPVSSTRKLISSSSLHHLDMTLAVAEALNPNKHLNHPYTCQLGISGPMLKQHLSTLETVITKPSMRLQESGTNIG